MKRTILAVLVAVMVATPCFAQEVNPNGLFSPDGTIWGIVDEGFSALRMGFADGLIYNCTYNPPSCDDESIFGASYFNFFLLSIFAAGDPSDEETFLGVLIPILGIGWGRVCPEGDPCILLTMEKLPDTFNPNM
jgi:hypothetical protein